MVTRLNEKYIFGALIDAAESNISGVLFYGPEEEPATSGYKSWCLMDSDYEETLSHRGEWLAEGRLTCIVSSRKEGNIYTARQVAHELTSLFDKDNAVTITVSESTVGYITFTGTPATHSMGEDDGIIHHWWSQKFYVNSVS